MDKKMISDRIKNKMLECGFTSNRQFYISYNNYHNLSGERNGTLADLLNDAKETTPDVKTLWKIVKFFKSKGVPCSI